MKIVFTDAFFFHIHFKKERNRSHTRAKFGLNSVRISWTCYSAKKKIDNRVEDIFCSVPLIKNKKRSFRRASSPSDLSSVIRLIIAGLELYSVHLKHISDQTASTCLKRNVALSHTLDDLYDYTSRNVSIESFWVKSNPACNFLLVNVVAWGVLSPKIRLRLSDANPGRCHQMTPLITDLLAYLHICWFIEIIYISKHVAKRICLWQHKLTIYIFTYLFAYLLCSPTNYLHAFLL